MTVQSKDRKELQFLFLHFPLITHNTYLPLLLLLSCRNSDQLNIANKIDVYKSRKSKIKRTPFKLQSSKKKKPTWKFREKGCWKAKHSFPLKIYQFGEYKVHSIAMCIKYACASSEGSNMPLGQI